MISWVLRKMKKAGSKADGTFHDKDQTSGMGSFHIDFSTIVAATNNFSEARRLGFSTVYKGVLANGQYIAVKRLAMDSAQCEIEFKNELLSVAKLRHRNLVRFIACCFEGKERLLLYEFVPNRSLDYYLFDADRCHVLDWPTRYKIIEGVVQGMVYLHEDSPLRIIHRDLKISNILLDEDLMPKISDFGLARLFQADQTREDNARVVGTLGYLAPESASGGVISIKTDVYSFGVVLLEIVSGQRRFVVTGERPDFDILQSIWRHWSSGAGLGVIDPVMSAVSRPQILRCIHIGLLCVQEEEAYRPTMSSVFLMLRDQSLSLPAPSSSYFVPSRVATPTSSSDEEVNSEFPEQNFPLDNQSTVTDESISEFNPRCQ